MFIETYDLEALLIKSTALESVLIEFGSTKKISCRAQNPRKELIDAALPIGCLRLHSRRSELTLKFDGMRYARFVDRDSLQTDVRELVREVRIDLSGRTWRMMIPFRRFSVSGAR